MKTNNILHIIIVILVIIASSSFYIGKISVSNENNKNQIVSEIKIGSIGVSEFKEKVNSDYVVIDIRTVEEVNSGRIESMDLNIDFDKDNFKSELNKLDKTKKYLIYCRSGNRTGSALSIMKELGFKEVYDLDGGIGSWERAGEKFIK